MSLKQQFSLKDTVYNITSTLPLIFSMAVCAGMGSFAGAVISCVAAFTFTLTEENNKTPLFASFLILAYAFKEFGASTASFSVMLCGLFLLLTAITFDKTKKSFEKLFSSDISGMIMFLAALSATILFTTDYFGIGASGNTNREIIQSYISLGFHPNWRGVLYGTIVMVVMITFPRKFKKFSKIINAAFIALIITTALNFLLNPADMTTAIKETGPLSFTEYKNNIFMSVFNSKPLINSHVYFCALSLYFVILSSAFHNIDIQKKDVYYIGIANFFGVRMICFPIVSLPQKNKVINGLISSAASALIFLILNGFIEKIPVHSCAVILIVGAWQSVKWGNVKNIFSSGLKIILFILNSLICLLFGYVFLPISAYISSVIITRNSNKQ